jgi:Ni/Fe-hydrogenase subunit HybB-like protein
MNTVKETINAVSMPRSFPRLVVAVLKSITDGGLAFYAWLTFLTALTLVGLNTYAIQLSDGLAVTSMSDHVSWGLYVSNFTYFVGLAAGGVMMVIPAYVYKNEAVNKVVIIGEILAIAAIVMAIGFITVDVGRPERLWHMAPIIGAPNWPMSILIWDVLVLTIYLLVNLYVVGYILHCRFINRIPDRKKYIPVVFFSIVWAISIHTVTAFLYSGLGGRPFWNSAVLAPRFIASAFVTGPAFLILALQVVRRMTRLPVSQESIRKLANIMRVTVLLNLFLLCSELFTEFYTGGAHTDSAMYLFFGLHGHNELVPWIWTSMGLNIVAAISLMYTARKPNDVLINVACVLSLTGIWIEKGLGLIVPGFVPSTLHEVVPYLPNFSEVKITIGIWALGLIVFTLGIKIATEILTDQVQYQPSDEELSKQEEA